MSKFGVIGGDDEKSLDTAVTAMAKMMGRNLSLGAISVAYRESISKPAIAFAVESGVGMEFDEGVDLDALVSNAAHRLLPFAHNDGVAIEIVPATGVPALIRANPDRLAQVIVNLVHNAIKFSQQGSGVRVIVAAHPEKRIATVSVIDRGVGISRADLGRIFERFFVADRSRSTGGGTGLGLSIARHIVQLHGGEIAAESTIGEGSTFTVSLPID